VDGSKICTHSTGAGACNCQARAVDLHGVEELCAREEREEVHDVVEDIMPGAGSEEPIVRREECEARCGRAL
jgi:hypothetical protein